MKTRRFYENAWYVLIIIYLGLIFFYFQKEVEIVENALWENPWFGLMNLLFGILFMWCTYIQSYLAGRDHERELSSLIKRINKKI